MEAPGGCSSSAGVLLLSRDSESGVPVLVVEGDVDVYAAPALRQELGTLADEGHERVVVECDGIDFINSTGLGVLVDTHERIRDRGGELVLRGLRPKARRVLDMAGLSTVLRVEERTGRD